MGRKNNLAGKRVGRLLIKNEAVREKNKNTVVWHCLCDCGKEISISASSLGGKRPTKSCGCLQLEAVRRQGYKNFKGPGVSVKHSAYAKYRWRAEQKGIDFKLTKEEFDVLVSLDCYYCGTKPSAIHRKELNRCGFLIGGVDRVESAAGYISSNTVPCCGMCNAAKSDYSKEEFLKMVEKIYIKHIK